MVPILMFSMSIVAVTSLNIIIYMYVKNKVLNRYIAPYLSEKNQHIEDTRFTGLFNRGDFGHSKFEIKPVSELGKIKNDTYVHVYTRDDKGEVIRYTVKITTIFLRIHKVVIRSDEKSLEIVLSRHVNIH